jgi:heme/copper-type cytochrome/quinol oxidase subunit 1
MSVTETRPPSSPEAGVEDVGAPVPQAELPGLAGWLTTVDHKRVGRLWIATAVLFLVAGSVAAVLLGIERIDTGFSVLDDETFGQVYTFQGEVLVFGFLVPLFVGVATAVVPLQVGTRAIAFPRLSTLAYWAYVASAGLLCAAYLANGGPGGGSDVGVDLYLLALGALNVATCAALVPVLTTALALRAPGMTLMRTPLFTWSVVVGGGLFLLAAPVLVSGLIGLYIETHFGGGFPGDGYESIQWAMSVPQVYLLAVPAAGVAAEVVPTMAGSRLRSHGAALVLLGALGVLGFGAYAQDPDTFDDLLYVGMGLAAVLPPLALLGLLGDGLRSGKPSPRAPLLLAMGGLVLLFLGALSGAVLVIEPLELQGTTWASGTVHLVVMGAGVLGAFAALWYWAPKLWGVLLGEWSGRAVFALVFLGALLLAGPELLAGLLEDQPVLSPGPPEGEDLVVVLNVLSAAGAVLATLGILVAVGDLLGKAARRRGRPATDDPWDGGTLEWATTSPPPLDNFPEPVPTVTSATPLRAEAEA